MGTHSHTQIPILTITCTHTHRPIAVGSASRQQPQCTQAVPLSVWSRALLTGCSHVVENSSGPVGANSWLNPREAGSEDGERALGQKRGARDCLCMHHGPVHFDTSIIRWRLVLVSVLLVVFAHKLLSELHVSHYCFQYSLHVPKQHCIANPLLRHKRCHDKYCNVASE